MGIFGVVLNLDRRVIELVLSPHEICHMVEGLEWMLRYDMAAHGVLARADRPKVEIVKLFHVIHLYDVVLKFLDVNLSWGTFHEHNYAVLEDWNRRETNDHREEIGTDWICESPAWPEIDDDSCSNNADTHQKIPKHVQISACHVDVLMSLWSSRLLVLRKKGLGQIVSVMMMLVVMLMVMVVSNFGRGMVAMGAASVMVFHVQDLHLNDVEAETKDGNYKHDASKHRLRCDDSQSSLIDKPEGEAPNEDDAYYSTDDL